MGVECLCTKGYIFDGARCVGMYHLIYYHLENICTSITTQMSYYYFFILSCFRSGESDVPVPDVNFMTFG